jgi:hypothetical protein
VYIRLVGVFLGLSCLIFGIAVRTIQMGFGSAHVPCSGTSCPFHTGEGCCIVYCSRLDTILNNDT